jgi:hypothetical protein
MSPIRSPLDGGRLRTSRLTLVVALALAAGAGLALAYGGRVDVGLHYDDYHLVRPWSFIELRRAWLGSWDPTGIEPAFYRPLTAALYAARFHLFALNAPAMHYVSLVGHGVCAVLLGWFLRREGAAVSLAAFGAWLYAVHPAFPYAQVSWLTNQMHLAASMVVLGSLLLWQTVRDRHAAWWIPLGALAAVAFLIKEDGIMLLPVLAAMTTLRVRLLDAKAPRWWPLLAGLAAVLVAALLAFRQMRLGRLGGYGSPDLAAFVPNYLKGLETAVLLWPTTRIWQAVASVLAAGTVAVALFVSRRRPDRRLLRLAGLALVIGLALNVPPAFHSKVAYDILAWQGLAGGAAMSLLALGLGIALWRGQRPALFLLAAGLVVALGFNLPFALVTKREQYHLIALGSALAMAGAAQAISSLSTRPRRRLVAGAVLVAATLPFPFLARHLAGDFLPCAGPVIRADEGVKGWWVVPQEIKGWIDLKARRCAAGLAPTPIRDLPLVAWDVYPEPVPNESPSARWTSERPVALFTREAVSATLALRRPDASSKGPVRVTLLSSGGRQVLTLDSGEWHDVTVRFASSPRAWLRRAQRVDLRVEPWFVPGARDPHSRDLRRHGVQWRVLAVEKAEPDSR